MSAVFCRRAAALAALAVLWGAVAAAASPRAVAVPENKPASGAATSVPTHPVDASHYRLDLTLGIPYSTIAGTATIAFHVSQSGADSASFDLVGLTVRG